MSEKLIKTILWTGGELPFREVCRFIDEGSGYRLEGTVVGELQGVIMDVRYDVHCTSNWHTREAAFEVRRQADVLYHKVHVDLNGRWTHNGKELPDMQGLVDVDLGITPSTNTLPIRRLALPVGGSAEVTAVWVKFPDLNIQPLVQRYTRLAERHYVYESAGGRFRADLEVDEHGLVTMYGNYWSVLTSYPRANA